MDQDDTQQDLMPTDPAMSNKDDVVPQDTTQSIPDEHPATDSNMDSHEIYDAGVDKAAEAQEPNQG